MTEKVVGGKTHKLGDGSFRWNGYFSEEDLSALDYLHRTLENKMLAETVRYAIAAQAERDRAASVPRRVEAAYRKHLPYDWKAAVGMTSNEAADLPRPRIRKNGWQPAGKRRGRDTVAKMDRQFFWFADKELAMLRDISAAHGMRGISEAVRFAVRVEACLAGFKTGGRLA